MPHIFPRKAFRAGELGIKADFDEALQPIAEKAAMGLNEHDISSQEPAAAGKIFPFASLDTSCYYEAYEKKAAVTMNLTGGAVYAQQSTTSAAGNTATILDTQEWQNIVDDVTGLALTKTINSGEDILFICAELQSAGWAAALGVSPTLASDNEYRLQYALRVDGTVYEDAMTGPAVFPDPTVQQIYSGVKAVTNTVDFDYRHKGWQQNGTGLPNHLQPARLTRCVPVVEGSHTVEVVVRRATRADGKPDNGGAGSSMQVFNRRLFVLRIKGWSKSAGSSAPTLSLQPWSEGEVISSANLNTNRLVAVKDALNGVVEASIQRGALHNEHLPSVVAYPDVQILDPAVAVLTCAATTYVSYGSNAGWNLLHDGAGNNLEVTGPGGAGFVLTANPGIMVVLANIQVRRIQAVPANNEARIAGCFIFRYKDAAGVEQYVAETEASITPRNQLGGLPTPRAGGTLFDANVVSGVLAPGQNYCEEDVAMLWVFDTAVFLAAHPTAATMQEIEVVCATTDCGLGLVVTMETQKATLTAFMLKGIVLS